MKFLHCEDTTLKAPRDFETVHERNTTWKLVDIAGMHLEHGADIEARESRGATFV